MKYLRKFHSFLEVKNETLQSCLSHSSQIFYHLANQGEDVCQSSTLGYRTCAIFTTPHFLRNL